MWSGSGCYDGRCECRPGYYGPACLLGCAGYVAETGAPCSGHGICVSTGSPGHSQEWCKCHAGFAGAACEKDLEGVAICPRDCSGRGTCRAGRCSCEPKFAGHDCSIELRHGRLAHALDSGAARVAAALACFVLTAGFAFGGLRYINRGVPGEDGERLTAREWQLRELKGGRRRLAKKVAP